MIHAKRAKINTDKATKLKTVRFTRCYNFHDVSEHILVRSTQGHSSCYVIMPKGSFRTSTLEHNGYDYEICSESNVDGEWKQVAMGSMAESMTEYLKDFKEEKSYYLIFISWA